MEPAQQHAVLDAGLAAVLLVFHVVDFTCGGGLVASSGPLAVLVAQGDGVADPGRDRLGEPDVQRQARPAQPGAELPAPQERRQPARAGQQVHGLADDRALEGLPCQGGVRGRRGRRRRRRRVVPLAAGAVRAGVAAGVVAEPVQLDAQPDQILQRAGVDLAGDERDHRRITGDGLGGVAVQPGAAAPAAGGGAGAVPGPLRPDPAGPLLQQRRAARRASSGRPGRCAPRP